MINNNEYKIIGGIRVLRYGFAFIQPVFKGKWGYYLQFRSGSGCRMAQITELDFRNIINSPTYIKFTNTEIINIDLNRLINGLLLDNNIIKLGYTDDFINELESQKDNLSKSNLKMLKEIKDKFGSVEEDCIENNNY
ncbi:MAG: hypothetical protein WCX32_03445 [Clostridia bacterium]|jgi:hypothetical protein|nr:hypothetical protein [Clostridia bacterium]MDD4275544.1 hypothetical protein [Clostridia bacterium]